MLSFTSRNVNGQYISYDYDNIADISKEYWSNKIDMNVPANDDPIVECEFMGTPLYFDRFQDLIEVFGINNDEAKWKE